MSWMGSRMHGEGEVQGSLRYIAGGSGGPDSMGPNSMDHTYGLMEYGPMDLGDVVIMSVLPLFLPTLERMNPVVRAHLGRDQGPTLFLDWHP